MSKKDKKKLIIGIYVLIALIFILLVYYYIKSKNDTILVVQNTTNSSIIDNSFDTYQKKQELGNEGKNLLEAAQKAYKELEMKYDAVCITSKFLTNKGYYNNDNFEGSILIVYNDSLKEVNRFWITDKNYLYINANPSSYLYTDAVTYSSDLDNLYKECNNEDITNKTIVKCLSDSCN